MCVSVNLSVVSSSLKSIDCNLPGFSVDEILQARILEWGAIALSEYPAYFTTISMDHIK